MNHQATLAATSSVIDVPMLIDGTWRTGDGQLSIHDPWRGDLVARASESTAADLNETLDAAVTASALMAAMSGRDRSQKLRFAADRVEARANEIAAALTRESGRAWRDTLNEVLRAADCLRLCAEEAIRIEGSHVPVDGTGIGVGKLALTLRFPVGVVAGITAFNAPVNMAAHKIGSALAAGNAVVLKPSVKTPFGTYLFVQALLEADFPPGAINILTGDAIAPGLVQDDRVDFVSFTGSIPVGKIIRNTVGMKRVALELGGVGPTFVAEDADIDLAARTCARHAVLVAGQSCVSVQNVFVAPTRYEEFLEIAERELDAVKYGDPMDPATEVGTLIDAGAVARVQAMIGRAVEAGATLRRQGTAQGAHLGAQLLTEVSSTMEFCTEEVFGPAFSISPCADFEAEYRRISRSPYGLQAGIFTNDLQRAFAAIRGLRTGGVIINGTSRWRSDQMPYGGVKDSGQGREGPKYAIREMTDERLVVFA